MRPDLCFGDVMNDASFFEKLALKIKNFFYPLRMYFAVSFFAGIVAYGFCFANKLEQMDDLACLFSTGASMSSGRWGLDITKHFLPSWSIPWLNGILCILLLSVSVCMILKVFPLRSKLLSALLAAVVVSFPSQTVTFSYMFTSVHYAFSVLLAVTALWVAVSGNTVKRYLVSSVLLAFSMAIYQAYIAVAVSLMLVSIISLCLYSNMETSNVWKKGLSYLGILACSAALYYGITSVLMRLSSTEFNYYAQKSMNSFSDMLFGLRVAYTSFIGYFIKGYYDIVSTPFSRVVHVLAACVTCVLIILLVPSLFRRDKKRTVILLLCLVLFPLGVNCVRVISSLFHNLMVLSFISVYVLACVVADGFSSSGAKAAGCVRDAVSLCLAVVLCVNICFSNKVYLKMYFQLEQAKSFYTTVFSCATMTPGYAAGTPVAFVGTSDSNLWDYPVDTSNLAGIMEGLIGVYSQDVLIRAFTGRDVPVVSDESLDALAASAEVMNMPCYPDYGSVALADGVLVVKLG